MPTVMGAMTKAEFLKKWGTHGWTLVIEEFIQRAPSFHGDLELAKTIGEIVADLQSVLEIKPKTADERLAEAIFGPGGFEAANKKPKA